MTNEQLIIDELLQEKRMLLGEKEKNEKRIKELEVIIERYKEICKYSSYKIAINTHNIENFRKNKDFHFSHPMTLEHLSFFILNKMSYEERHMRKLQRESKFLSMKRRSAQERMQPYQDEKKYLEFENIDIKNRIVIIDYELEKNQINQTPKIKVLKKEA